MKKIKFLLLGWLVAVGLNAQAQTEDVDTLIYELNDDGVTLTKVQHLADSTLVIPDSTVIDGTKYEVTTINIQGSSLLPSNFPDRNKCKKIFVPKTVRTIICMGGGYTYLDSIVIAKDSRLESITAKNYSRPAISYCNNLNLPASLKTVTQRSIAYTKNVVLEMDSVPENCLYYNSMLENVVFSPTTKYIGESAFYNCKTLTEVQLPEGIEEIGSTAFYGCDEMKKVTLPASVTNIGSKAFYGAEYVVAKGEEPAALGSNAFATNATIIVPISAYKKYTEADGWKDYNIGADDFTVDNVRYTPTNGTLRVSGNTVPDEGTLTIPETVEYEGNTFKVAEIADGALSCGAKELIIEAPLTTIGSRHLFRYRYLTTVKLPNCLREIPDQIFEYCNKLEAIELPDSLRKIGNNAFENTSLKSITLPDSLNSIGSYAFASCYMLKDVKLPANLTSINSGAFKGCSLTEISLPAGLESIGGDAFLGCPIKEISLPAGLEDLGFGAFAYTDIESVTIPAATTVENPFYCCRYLKNIFVDKANEKCFDIDGVLYNKYYPVSSTGTIEPGECWNRLICYPAGREDKTYNVPEDTKVILQNAFTGTCNLHSVYANEGLAYVAQFAFCKSSVEYIDLPSTIEGMYFSSFGGNSAKLVNLKATTVPERFGLGNDFSNNYEDAYRDYPVILCVPENSAETYRSISGIESSYKIVTRHVEAADVHYVSENEGEMTAVCATYDADSTLTINDEVTDEFQNKYVVKRINDRAFYNAYNAYDSLKTIAFPATVEYIGTDAMNAPKLKEIRYTAEESPYFTVMDGVLFSKDTTTLMKYPSMKEVKTYVVPATVDSICQNAMFLTGEYPLEDLYILNKGLIWKSWSYVSAPNTTLYVRQSFIGQDQIDDMEPYFKAIVVLSDEEADRLLTDIQGVSADSKNGVADDGWYYTLSGMRVKQPAKGLYIRNGKKVVIK